jgi:threonine/homoserine/homoserine lactone efflux protein
MREKFSINFLSVVFYLFALTSLAIGLFQYRDTGRLLLPLISLGCALYFLFLGLMYSRGSGSKRNFSDR